MRVEVQGFRELDAALAQLPEALRRPVVLAALRKAARPMVAEARTRVRRGRDPRRRGSKKQRRSGEAVLIGPLADSIRASAARDASGTGASIAVGPDRRHFYGMFLEFGTSRQPPRRFLTPAFEIRKEDAVRLVGEELWKALAAAARRLSGRAEKGTLTKRAREALLP